MTKIVLTVYKPETSTMAQNKTRLLRILVFTWPGRSYPVEGYAKAPFPPKPVI